MRDQSWVSKADVISYRRCPYAFWLVDSGQLSKLELLSPFEKRLTQDGVSFERGIVEAAPPIALPPGGEAELFGQDHTLLEVRTFRNPRLRLIGHPDGLVTAGGSLQPIEIKSHRLLRHSDRIELAFYWLLLSDIRTADAAAPMGWVFLRAQGGSITRQPVALTPRVLADTEALIKAVRYARRHGVEPVICRCTVCRGVRRHEVRESVRKRRHLSSVIGVGARRRTALQDLGYTTWEDLLKENAEDLAQAFNLVVTGPTVNVREVQRWQSHARALVANKVQLADDDTLFPVPERYIVFDAEYTADNTWLLGVRVVRSEGHLCYAIWASPKGEAQALAEFAAILRRFPGLPVVTWNGRSADVPAIRKAAARAGDNDLLALLTDRHIDLYLWTRQNIFLPISGLGLKEVGAYFGIARESGVTSGQAAEDMWRRYQRSGDQELKAELVSYSLDDLQSLVYATEYLRAHAAGHSPQTAAVHPVLETVVSEHEPTGPPVWGPELALPRARPPLRRAAATPPAWKTWRQEWRKLWFWLGSLPGRRVRAVASPAATPDRQALDQRLTRQHGQRHH